MILLSEFEVFSCFLIIFFHDNRRINDIKYFLEYYPFLSVSHWKYPGTDKNSVSNIDPVFILNFDILSIIDFFHFWAMESKYYLFLFLSFLVPAYIFHSRQVPHSPQPGPDPGTKT